MGVTMLMLIQHFYTQSHTHTQHIVRVQTILNQWQYLENFTSYRCNQKHMFENVFSNEREWGSFFPQLLQGTWNHKMQGRLHAVYQLSLANESEKNEC